MDTIRLKWDLFRYRLPEVELKQLVDVSIEIESPIKEGAFLPPYNRRQFKHDDMTPLLKLIRVLQPEIVLELGTAYGNLVANIANQAGHAKIYTVNGLPEEIRMGQYTTFLPSVEEIGYVYRKYGFSEQVIQIYADTLNLELSKYFDEPVIDFAIIDASHDYEYILHDFLNVYPYIRPGGIVLLHDTHPSMKRHLLQSYRACVELRKQCFDIKHIQDTWWGIWVKPPVDVHK